MLSRDSKPPALRSLARLLGAKRLGVTLILRSSRPVGVPLRGAELGRNRWPCNDAIQRVEKRLHLAELLRLPAAHVLFSRARHLLQEIHTAQQLIDMPLLQGDATLLRGHERVFHRVRDAHARAQADDPRCAFERMLRPHAALNLLCRVRVALERQQSQRQDLGLRLDFHANEIKHQPLAENLASYPPPPPPPSTP